MRTIYLALPAAVLLLALAAPADAQFGGIFGGPREPRPPADIPDESYPTDPRLPPRVREQRQDDRRERRYDDRPGYYEAARPGRYDPRSDPRSDTYDPRVQDPDEAPRPPPLRRLSPPSGQPGAVQNQPLPPPPGSTAPPASAPQATAPAQEGVGTGAGQGGVQGAGVTPNALPGLPPGQRQPRGTPQPQQQPNDEVVVAPPTQKIVNPTAVFAGLDKITGRIISFDVAIGETVQFGALRLTPRACYTRPPTETPNTDGFVEVDEITLQGEVKRIFTGWMFAASPGLHGVEHPIYDVWLTDCKKESLPGAQAQQTTPAPAAAEAPVADKPAAKPAAPKPAATPAARR